MKGWQIAAGRIRVGDAIGFQHNPSIARPIRVSRTLLIQNFNSNAVLLERLAVSTVKSAGRPVIQHGAASVTDKGHNKFRSSLAVSRACLPDDWKRILALRTKWTGNYYEMPKLQ